MSNRTVKQCTECGKDTVFYCKGKCGACYARMYRETIITPEHKAAEAEKRRLYRLENKDRINAYWRKRRSTTRKYRIAFEKKHGLRKTKPRSEEYKAKVIGTQFKVAQYKLEKGCIDCGYNTNSIALDFDHLRDKEFNISSAARSNMNPEKLWAEIAKCVVRCANCHRIITKTRRDELAALPTTTS